jgi:hypothetical protein
MNGKKPLSGPNDPVKPIDQEFTIVASPSRHHNTFKMRSNISGNTEHLVPKLLFTTPAFLRWLVYYANSLFTNQLQTSSRRFKDLLTTSVSV